MKMRERTAVVIPLIVWTILAWTPSCCLPAGGSPVAKAARPAGHAPPPTTLRDDAPSLGEIIERYIEAVGGRSALERLETRVVRGRIVTDLPTRYPPVFEVDTLTVYSEVPGRYLVVHQSSRGTVLEAHDGTTGWKRDVEGKAFAFDGADAHGAWLVDPQFRLRLDEYFPEMVYLGETTIQGRALHVVDVDGDHLHRLYFNVKSGLPARLGYNRTIARYGEVDGVKVPFEVEYSRKGGSSTFVFDAVVHNVPIDARLFSPPESY